MNRFWKTTKAAAAYTAGAVAGGAICALLGLAILTPEKTPSGQYTDPVKYWTDNQYYTEQFIIAANAAELETIAARATDWECEQCGAACENPDYEE